MYENPFIKVYLIQHAFEVERDSLETKSKTISSYQTTKLLNIGFLLLVSVIRRKKIKGNL